MLQVNYNITLIWYASGVQMMYTKLENNFFQEFFLNHDIE